jgi:16S rRNA processing protein RimM
MTERKRILIGEIATAHGIKGYVKVRCFAEDKTLLESEHVRMADGTPVSLKLKHAIKEDWAAEVKGVSDRNAAERLRGTKLYVDRGALPDTDDGELYIEDMIGLKVVDEKGSIIGTLESVQNYGASDLLDIKPIDGGQNFYLPYTEDCVVDLDAGTIIVTMPEIFE